MKDRYKLREFDECIKSILDERNTGKIIYNRTDMKCLITIIRAIQSSHSSILMITKYTDYVAYHRSIIDTIEFECMNDIRVAYLYPGDFSNSKFENKFENISEHLNFIVGQSELYNKQIEEILPNCRFALLIDSHYLIIIADSYIEFKKLTDTEKYNKLFKLRCSY